MLPGGVPPSGYPLSGREHPGGYPPAQPADFVGRLRSNKLLLHLAAGTVGGAVGALLAEVIGQEPTRGAFTAVMETGFWSCIFTSVIATALFVSDKWHQRKDLQPRRLALIWLYGAGAGFVAGAVAQTVFTLDIGSFEFKNYVLRTFCWGIAGALIGCLLSRTVPNLSMPKGTLAGFVGGCLGGIGFVLVSNQLPDMWGRLVGVGALGFALGLAMFLVESIFREASLEIIWAPNETTRVTIGAEPISIGGDREDDVVVRGLPPGVSSIVLNNGRIEHIENHTANRTTLTDGSQLQIGPIHLIVHARR